MTIARGASAIRVAISAAVLVVILFAPVFKPAADAGAVGGACCLPDGGCEDLGDTVCANRNGSFIGFNATCANINCQRTPALSLGGLVLAAGGLATVGIARLLGRRRREAARISS